MILFYRSDHPFDTIAEAEASGLPMVTVRIPAEERLVSSINTMLAYLLAHDKDDAINLGQPSATFRYGVVDYIGVWRTNNPEDVRIYAVIDLPDDDAIWTTPLYKTADFFLNLSEP
jgi:hypothetical protein